MVAGFDVASQAKSVRRHIGLVFQEQTLDDQLTARGESSVPRRPVRSPPRSGRRAITRVLGLVALSDRRKDLVSTYSGGMARRLEIARGMLHTPGCSFSMSRQSASILRPGPSYGTISNACESEEGVTIFLTTHYMDEAEYAERIAIIDHGSDHRPRYARRAQGIGRHGHGGGWKRPMTTAALASLTRRDTRLRRTEGGLTAFVADEEAAVGPIVAAAGVSVHTVRAHRPTLDDVFLHFTGREIREQHGEAVSMSPGTWSPRG